MTTQKLRIHFFPNCETKLRTFCRAFCDSNEANMLSGSRNSLPVIPDVSDIFPSIGKLDRKSVALTTG
jgi:hypothetical protein